MTSHTLINKLVIWRKIVPVLLMSAALTACVGSTDSGGTSGGTASATDFSAIRDTSVELCSVADINLWIDSRMRDDYIYYDQVPSLNLEDYDNSFQLLRDLRVDPDIYSSVVDQVENELLIVDSNVTRFGFWLQQASDGAFRFADISGNSPMESAGIARGDRLLAVNGVNYEDITSEQYAEFVIGEPGELLTAVFTVQQGDAQPVDISVTKQSYIESTVPVSGTYAQTDDQVGYLRVNAFRGTTTDEINEAMVHLSDSNISELILDLRYNGGGFTRSARALASQIAGSAFVGEVYSRRQFNDKYSNFNTDQLIEPQDITLDLSRVFVLTTPGTASASETLINGLKPLIDVVVIGARTTGKPFTSVAQDYCGKRLNAMSTITTNGAGMSVLGGVAPTCAVSDDYLAASDDPADALTGAAFYFMQNDSCPTTVLASTRNRSVLSNTTSSDQAQLIQ